MTRGLLLLAMVGLILNLTGSVTVADDLSAKDHIEYFKPFVGSWKVTVESDGKVIEGTWKGRLSPAKTCYMSRLSGSGLPEFQSIDGYDPVAKTWTVVAFQSDGAFAINKMRFHDVQKGKHYAKGHVATGENIINQADGTVTKITSKGVCQECSKDRIVWVVSDRKINGEPAADEKWTLVRQAE